MNCYTVITEYKGGTFICQLVAEDEIEVIQRWCMEKIHEVFKEEEEIEYKKVKSLLGFKPIRISGLNNVWCADITIFDEYMSQTIVLTNVEC